MKTRYPRAFSLSESDERDFLTCLCKFSAIEILRVGIKECLEQCPKPTKEMVGKAKELAAK